MAPASLCALSLCAALLCAAAQVQPTDPAGRRMLSRHRERFHVVYEWKTFNYSWPSFERYRSAVADKEYVPENVIVSGLKIFGDRMYLTLPRMKPGVPATLAWIPVNSSTPNDTSPSLNPFPSWEQNAIGDCDSFQSVQSVEIDAKGVMWVIDNGRTATMNRPNDTKTCRPSLSLIDLNDGKNLVTRFAFPDSVVNASGYLNDIVVDDTDDGYAYITDNSRTDPGIVVFSRKESKSWKFRDYNSMLAAKNAIYFAVGRVETNMTVNVDGIALGPRYVNNKNAVDRNVYFCPMSSFRLYGTPASVLRDESLSSASADVRMRLVVNLGEKASQTDGMIMDEEGYLFFGLLGEHSIAQWNNKEAFSSHQEIVAHDKEYLQWVDRFAFDNDVNMYVVINKLHNFVTGRVDPEAYNYRILRTRTGTKSYLYSPVLLPVPSAAASAGASALLLLAAALLLR